MSKHKIFISLFSLMVTIAIAQQSPSDYLSKSWRVVATQMPDEWHNTQEARNAADNLLLHQKNIGGWEKNKNFHQPLNESEKQKLLQTKDDVGATFDNNATIMELRFLARVYAKTMDSRYKTAFEKGLDYIVVSQYENGGWPQFFPFRSGSSVDYARQITYNDNAMVNIMKFIKEVMEGETIYAPLQVQTDLKSKLKNAFDKGVECIINTQIIVEGKPTVWCAQHDAVTLLPAKARAYELPSFSGAESAGIVTLLMDIENPNNKVIKSVTAAINWFEENKITGLRIGTETDAEGRRNRIEVNDADAPAIWARFYDLDTKEPFVCDRDGIKRKHLSEIGFERRNGYSWYNYHPAKLIEKFPQWKKKWNIE